MNHEFKRMQELAGLTEIKINKPKHFVKLNLPFDSTNSNIPIPVDEYKDKYDSLIEDLINLNQQIDPKFFLLNHAGMHDDIFDTLYDNDGATVSEFYEIYFGWLWSNLVINYNQYSDEEVDNRINQYINSGMTKEFVDNAMKGKWLTVAGVTD